MYETYTFDPSADWPVNSDVDPDFFHLGTSEVALDESIGGHPLLGVSDLAMLRQAEINRGDQQVR